MAPRSLKKTLLGDKTGQRPIQLFERQTSERRRGVYEFSKVNAVRRRRGDVSLLDTRRNASCLYLPLQGHVGGFRALPLRKNAGVSNEQEDLC